MDNNITSKLKYKEPVVKFSYKYEEMKENAGYFAILVLVIVLFVSLLF